MTNTQIFHKNLASGKWHTMSLTEQLGNIGSEVSRAEKWQNKDKKTFNGAVDRALELFDLTLRDSRWRIPALTEIARAREVFCDAYFGGHEYGSSFSGLNHYFLHFGLLARRNK